MELFTVKLRRFFMALILATLASVTSILMVMIMLIMIIFVSAKGHKKQGTAKTGKLKIHYGEPIMPKSGTRCSVAVK